MIHKIIIYKKISNLFYYIYIVISKGLNSENMQFRRYILLSVN